MKQFSEAVLDGHPDRLCDLIADRIVNAAMAQDADAFAQIEAAIWRDQVFLTGTIATREDFQADITALVRDTGRDIGYRAGNPIKASDFQVTDHVTKVISDPLRWTAHCNDQCVVKGWAGYDGLTNYLPPEHFAVWHFRDQLVASLKGGALDGFGPDGKVLVVTEEYPSEWYIKKLLVTLQQPMELPFTEFLSRTAGELRKIFGMIQRHDRRWSGRWEDMEVLINPNGPLMDGGPLSDNGQTGRKLVMDHYGPRIPIGGGALYGKHHTHIDRLASAAARRFCIDLVKAGSEEAKVDLAYAPGCSAPLEVKVSATVRPHVNVREYFRFGEMVGKAGLKFTQGPGRALP